MISNFFRKIKFPSIWKRVRVWVDYNVAGTMTRLPLAAGATLTGSSAPGIGRIEYAENNHTGVWLIGNADIAGSFSATVQLLTTTAGLSGVCAYASNYPPVGEYTSATDVAFTGTPMYNIVLKHASGGTITRRSDSLFSMLASYAIQSFTDATGASGLLTNLVLPLQAASTQTWTFSGSSLTWSDRIITTQVNCTPVTTLSSSGTAAEYIISSNLYFYNWYCLSAAESHTCPSPWHIPTREEIDGLVNA